ncbi:hypothetical protein [Roseateles amylovorans]|uniref:DUF1043 family protein n=1 Tax=Roseateles amylovorans TaxID=2978473 RepID=A0ABY6B664_9BURK|nr:hypothetical protein [Roseateles amylovorans]UXH80664.1 hypothetical protein N4261_12625 [Roseateles amylovorans]
MNNLQPWMAIAGSLAGVALGIAGASWQWSRRLSVVQRAADRIRASRDLLDQQNTQARRQIEQMQVEMATLRLTADRVRRREPFIPVVPEPAAPPAARPSVLEVERMLAQNDQRQPAMALDDGDAGDHGFAPTQVDPPETP